MIRPKRFEIEFDSPGPVYFSDQVVGGKVILETDEPMTLKGKLKVTKVPVGKSILNPWRPFEIKGEHFPHSSGRQKENEWFNPISPELRFKTHIKPIISMATLRYQ